MATDTRSRELAKIHILAKRDLGMDDDTYRSMLEQVGGVRSAKELHAPGRRKVLDYLARQLGRETPKSAKPQLSKIDALLAEAGRTRTYADGIAKQMFDIDRVIWCEGEQLRAIIAALVYDARRHTRVE